MAHKITFTRDRAEPFNDGELRELAAKLKAERGGTATVPYELHNFAAMKLDAAARRTASNGVGYDVAMKNAMQDHPHLQFLATCERSDNQRDLDVSLEDNE